MLLDMPLDSVTVTPAELKDFTTRTFGLGKVSEADMERVKPVFPPDSLFMRRFKSAVGVDGGSEASAPAKWTPIGSQDPDFPPSPEGANATGGDPVPAERATGGSR